MLVNRGSLRNWSAFHTPPPEQILASPVKHCIDMKVHNPYHMVSTVWLGCVRTRVRRAVGAAQPARVAG